MYPPLGEGDAGLSDPIAPMYGGGMSIGGLKIPKHAPSKEDAGLNGPIDPKHWKGGTRLGGPQIPTHSPGKETKGSVTPQSHLWGDICMDVPQSPKHPLREEDAGLGDPTDPNHGGGAHVWGDPKSQHTHPGKRMQGSTTP